MKGIELDALGLFVVKMVVQLKKSYYLEMDRVGRLKMIDFVFQWKMYDGLGRRKDIETLKSQSMIKKCNDCNLVFTESDFVKIVEPIT